MLGILKGSLCSLGPSVSQEISGLSLGRAEMMHSVQVLKDLKRLPSLALLEAFSRCYHALKEGLEMLTDISPHSPALTATFSVLPQDSVKPVGMRWWVGRGRLALGLDSLRS